MKKRAIIVDLDGTLTNCEHRVHHVQNDPKDWKSFSEKMIEDDLHQWCHILITSMHKVKSDVIFLTGRGEKYRPHTEKWLNKHHINYDALYMRARGDYREDAVVKREIYLENISKEYEVLFVLEDRSSVVKMWRELGLTCLQCAEGNF